MGIKYGAVPFQCTKQHVVDCPDYSKGSCPRGDKCLLRHKKIALKKTTTRQQPVAPTKTPLAFKRLRRKLPVLESEHAKQGSRIRHTLVAGDSGNDDKVLSHDEDSESCDDSSDDQQPCYSPLDPNRPGNFCCDVFRGNFCCDVFKGNFCYDVVVFTYVRCPHFRSTNVRASDM